MGTNRSGSFQDWETGLIFASVNEENWSASVGMVIPVSGTESEIVNWLLSEIKNGNRQRFKAITLNEILQMVEGGINAVKAKSPSTNIIYTEVLTSAKVHLTEAKTIPVDLLAKLIKFQILIWKSESVKDSSGSTPRSERGKSPKPSTSANLEPSRLNRLKYRNGEGPPTELIDDEPFTGPHLYVLLFGFHDADIIIALDNVNLPLDTVIKVQLVTEKPNGTQVTTSTEDLKAFQLPGMAEAEKKFNKKLNEFWKKFHFVFANADATSQLNGVIFQDLKIFSWEVPSIMCCADTQNSFRASLYTNLAKLMYAIQDLKRQHENWLNHINFIHVPSFGEQKQEFFQTKLDAGLDNDIPLQAEFLLPDMATYERMLNKVPSECISVPIVLHCLVEQVVETVGNQMKPVNDYKEEKDTLCVQLEKIFDKCMMNYSTPMQFLPPVNTFKPLLICFGDEIKSKSHHISIEHLDLEKISNELMKTNPIVTAVLQFPNVSTNQKNIQSARFQHLISLFRPGEITPAEIDWALKLLAFETMVLQTSDFHGNINKQFQSPIPWDDPYSIPVEVYKSEEMTFPIVTNFSRGGKAVCCASESKNVLIKVCSRASVTMKYCHESRDLIQCECMNRKNDSKLSGLRSKSIITNSRCVQCFKGSEGSKLAISNQQFSYLRNLQDFNYVEFFPPNVFHQVLNDALSILHCVDIIYYKRDPCHLLVLHNPYNSQKHCCMLWSTKVNTNVSLRNFQLYVLPTISNWIEKEEAAYSTLKRLEDSPPKRSTGDQDFNLLSSSHHFGNVVGDPEWVPLCILNSLKHRIVQDQSSSYNVGVISFRHGDLTKIKANEERKSRKSRMEVPIKKPRADSTNSTDGFKQLLHPAKDEELPFQGYDLGNFILHITGSINYLYPSSKSQICIEKYAYVLGRQRIKLTIYDQGTTIFIHPPIIERTGKWNESVHVILSDGIRVHAKRPAISDLVASQHSFYTTGGSDEDSTGKQGTSSPSVKSNENAGSQYSTSTTTNRSKQMDSPLWITFTLPNKLVVQVNADFEKGMFFVRQYFLENESNEEFCRTFTLKGNVIKTLKKSRTEILQPDGSVLKTDWTLFVDVQSKSTSTVDTKWKVGSQESLTTKGSTSMASLEEGSQNESRSPTIFEAEVLKPSGPPWSVLTPTGRQFQVQLGLWTITECDYVLAYRAIDPGTKEEYRVREDGLHIIHERNRHYIAHHYDGTRITTRYKRGGKCETDTIRIEKPNFVTVITNPQTGTFDIQLSQNFNVIIKPSGSCVIHQKNGTQLAYHTDGSLLFSPQTKSTTDTSCNENARPFNTFVIYPYEETVLEAYDDLGQQFAVNCNGVITVSGIPQEVNEENDTLSRRYFIAYPDGSGSELCNEKQVLQVLNCSSESSLCQIDNNLLPNNMYVEGYQIFTPLAKTCLDEWTTLYEMEAIVPSGLTSRDLQPIPPLAPRHHRHSFGYGVGNGLHIKPIGKETVGLCRHGAEYPAVWQLRTFLKFRKMTKQWREYFQSKINDLNKVIKQMDVQKQRAQVIDSRPLTEQQLSASLLSLAKATGLPKKKAEKGIKSKVAGAEKKMCKLGNQNKWCKSNSFHRLCTDLRFNQNKMKMYATTKNFPPFFKCQLGKDMLLKAKKLDQTSSKLSLCEPPLSPTEKTPPLLKGIAKKSDGLIEAQKFAVKKKEEKRSTKTPAINLPAWANVQCLNPNHQEIKRARFLVKPKQVDFGRISEGTTLRHRVYLKNDGVENSAIRVVQPPKHTGISVSYNPTLVIAGMQAILDVEIHSIMPASVNENCEGGIYHELEIRTDIETVYLPITAKIVRRNESASSISCL